jgi:hypothetical protein
MEFIGKRPAFFSWTDLHGDGSSTTLDHGRRAEGFAETGSEDEEAAAAGASVRRESDDT